ncbi:MAG: DUF4388 domain-containing protein [bacterium]|nr:DUF4388 domain-containing protein [bacterium]
MAFQGSLKELPLPDIIQLVSVSGKTGAFVLTSSEQTGEIYLRDGEMVHSQVGGLQGEEAVYELAIWQEGQFTFKPGLETDQHTIKKSNTNLLMEAARRIDEWQVLSKRIPSTRLVPAFTNQGSSTSVSFTPHEWAVICKIDERRTIEELAAVLGLSPFEVSKLLYGLVTAGLVELKEGLGQLETDRLKQLSPTELSGVTQQIHEQAAVLLAHHEKLPQIEATTRRAEKDLEAGRGFEAVLDMVRSFEQTILAALGPNQSRAFLERVNQLLRG